MGHDLGQTGHRFQWGKAFGFCFSWSQHRHRNQLVVFERIFQQGTIAGLKDVKRLHHVREHDHLGNRKQPHGIRMILRIKRPIVHNSSPKNSLKVRPADWPAVWYHCHSSASPACSFVAFASASSSRWISGINSGLMSTRGNASSALRTSPKHSSISTKRWSRLHPRCIGR